MTAFSSRFRVRGTIWTAAAILSCVGCRETKAAVVISTAPTSGISCSAGRCVPTAPDAVLNAHDLEAMLGAGDVTVSTTGAGVQAQDILVVGPTFNSGTTALSLDAYRSIAIQGHVTVQSIGALSLTTNDGGSEGEISFGRIGRVVFGDVAGVLRINGRTYKLEYSIKTLANDISFSPRGVFALAASYDATADGVYAAAPVPTPFTGTFTGLGNTISRLSVFDSSENNAVNKVGLFGKIGASGTVSGIHLKNVNVVSSAHSYAGALAGENDGTVRDTTASGKVTLMKPVVFGDGAAGGLIGYDDGSVSAALAHVTVRGAASTTAGGLIGLMMKGQAQDVYATGAVTGSTAAGGLIGATVQANVTRAFATGAVVGIRSSLVGGLVGYAEAGSAIADCYAIGAATGGDEAYVGGLVGKNTGAVTTSYATGAPTGGAMARLGGMVGYQAGTLQSTYWDTTTSGAAAAVGYGPATGATGLTTAQLQSALPPGFSPTVWGQSAVVNGGLPFLLAIPPR